LLGAELAGYLVAVATIRIVLGPVIHSVPLVGMALKISVVIYLGWIAFRLWTHDASLTGTQAVGWQSVFVTTLLNPKALIFALSIVPAQHPQLAWYFVAFALAVPSVGFGWILVGRAIGAASGEKNGGFVRRVASVALVGFAGVIAVSVLG
jgi:threonine/homoserine/homoserine lactone efflux protein